MYTNGSEWVNQEFIDLRNEIIALSTKHNLLIESISRLWSEVHRTTDDPITRRLCDKRVEQLQTLLHSPEQYSPIPPEPLQETSWD